MAQKNRTDLKAFFETGDKPTQSQFADLIDSFYNIAEDATGWQTPTLQNGFVNYGGNYTAARYRKIHDIVYLEGLIKLGTVNTVIFNLPVGYRPSGTLILSGLGGNTNIKRIDIKADGNVLAISHSSSWMSLSGISFFVD